MKRNMFFTLLLVSVVFVSCNKKADEKTVNKMADEVCNAMALIIDEDPMSIIEAHSALLKIEENTEEYGNVTEIQLLSVMDEKCPDGANKYKNLVSESEEEPTE